MADFITIEMADAHLGLGLLSSGDEREDDLQVKIDQAEAIVFDYLKADPSDYSGEELPKHIEAAILLQLSDLWDARGGTDNEGDYLKPDGVVARLLARSRDPAIA